MQWTNVINWSSGRDNLMDNNVNSVKCRRCNLLELPESLFNLTNLVYLDCSDNCLKELSDNIGKLTKLEILNIGDNQIESFPESIKNLTSLHTLHIYNNKFKSMVNINALVNLQELECSEQLSIDFAANFCIDKLINLTTLSCSNNNLLTLPISIKELKNLKKLHIHNNLLESLPDYIGNLINLTEIYCSHNNLTTLPESIGLLTNLTHLYCSHNNLTTLPNSIGLLTNLTELACCYNNLSSLPESIVLCVNLIKLYCDNNRLTNLPESIELYVNLTELYCYRNKLTSLPKSIGLSVNLIKLSCENNNLTTLPAELGNCRRLENLYYYGNPIEFIPINVQRLLNRMKNHQGIYGDKQNVHNREIQQSISKSVYSLLNDTLVRQLSVKNSTIDNIIKSSLNDKTKSALIEYSEDVSVHTVLNISFKELLDYVWQRIENHPDKENILRILEDEMSDAECKCFTGRISRLVNCLNGFYDDICVEIGEKEQISNIIILIKNKLIDENNYTIENHKQHVIGALKERNYSNSDINKWIEYIE